ASLAAGLRWCNRRRCRAERDLLATAAVISRGRPMALPSTPIARPTLKAPLAVGDIAPEVVLRAVDGATIELNGDTMAGNVIIVLFCPRFSAGVGQAVAALRASAEAFVAAGAKLVAITLEPAKVAAEQALPFPLLLDRSGDVFRAYNADQREAPTTVVLRANQHVAAILKDAPGAQVSAALGVVERLAAARQSGLMAPHPDLRDARQDLRRAEARRRQDDHRLQDAHSRIRPERSHRSLAGGGRHQHVHRRPVADAPLPRDPPRLPVPHHAARDDAHRLLHRLARRRAAWPSRRFRADRCPSPLRHVDQPQYRGLRGRRAALSRIRRPALPAGDGGGDRLLLLAAA